MSAEDPNFDRPSSSQRGPLRLLLGIGLAMFFAALGWVAYQQVSFELDHSDGGVRRIRRQVAELKAGTKKSLYLISIHNTEVLLEQIRGMPEIADVYIEDTDITAAGMRNLGTLPNLKSLMAYDNVEGGEGMLELRNCTKLKSLSIYDGSITEDDIAELVRHIPNVQVSTKHD